MENKGPPLEKDNMTDKNIQKPGQVMQSREPSDWRSSLGAYFRQRVVKYLTEAMMVLPQHKNLSEVQKVAREYEKQIFSMALNKGDYLKRMTLKCSRIRELAKTDATQFSVVSSPTGGPSSLNSESRNIKPVETQHNQLVQSVNHTQPSNVQVSGISASAVTAVVQASRRGDTTSSGTASASVLTRDPLIGPKKSEDDESVDVVGNAEDFSEYVYQWILAMRDKYLVVLETELPVFARLQKELGLKPESPAKEKTKKKLVGDIGRLKQMLALLRPSRENVVRVNQNIGANKKILDAWEENIRDQIRYFKNFAVYSASKREKQDHHLGERSKRSEVIENMAATDLQSHSTQKIQRILPEEQPRVYPESDSLSLPTSRDSGDNHLSTSRLPHATPLKVSECDNLNINVGRNSETISPIQRLVNALRSVSSDSLKSAVKDISSVVSLVDGKVATAPWTGVKFPLMRDFTSVCSMPSESPNLQQDNSGTCYPGQFTNAMSTEESTTESSMKYPTTEAAHPLMQEIENINRRLIDTIVKVLPMTIGTQNDSGIMVECCFEGVSISSSLTQHMELEGISTTIQPLRLSVPADYSGDAPIFFDELKCQTGEESNDLTLQAKSRFGMRHTGVKNCASLKEIVVMWDNSCREVFAEYAKKIGGGSFSSIYGTWKTY